MSHAELRERMTEVMSVARDVLADPGPIQATRLWGCACELCDVLECDVYTDSRRALVTALREDIRVGARPTCDLAEEVVWFLRVVEHDLEDDELDALVDDVVTTDQSDG